MPSADKRKKNLPRAPARVDAYARIIELGRQEMVEWIKAHPDGDDAFYREIEQLTLRAVATLFAVLDEYAILYLDEEAELRRCRDKLEEQERVHRAP